MKKVICKALVRLNKIVLPSYSKKDPMRLTNLQKAIVAYRYWALTNSLR